MLKSVQIFGYALMSGTRVHHLVN